MRPSDYESYFTQKQMAYEQACKRCGRCCGSFNDPCVNLKKLPDSTYICVDYANRLGPQKTISGKIFNCVTIDSLLKIDACDPSCGYVKRSNYAYIG